jgi:hypothetical protein
VPVICSYVVFVDSRGGVYRQVTPSRMVRLDCPGFCGNLRLDAQVVASTVWHYAPKVGGVLRSRWVSPLNVTRWSRARGGLGIASPCPSR